MFAWAYHGQSKTIEPFHRHYAALARTLPTARGNSIENKPAHLKRGEFFHKALYKNAVGDYAPTMLAAHQLIASFIDEYAVEPRGGKYLNGKSPLEVFQNSMERVRARADFEARLVTPDELDFLMMSEQKVSIQKSYIKFRGSLYYHDALADLPKRRRDFSLRYDIENLDSVRVYDEDGEFICTAVKWNDEHPMARLLGTAEDREKLAGKITQIKSLKSGALVEAKVLLESEQKRIARATKQLEAKKKTGTDANSDDEKPMRGVVLPSGKVIDLF